MRCPRQNLCVTGPCFNSQQSFLPMAHPSFLLCPRAARASGPSLLLFLLKAALSCSQWLSEALWLCPPVSSPWSLRRAPAWGAGRELTFPVVPSPFGPAGKAGGEQGPDLRRCSIFPLLDQRLCWTSATPVPSCAEAAPLLQRINQHFGFQMRLMETSPASREIFFHQ